MTKKMQVKSNMIYFYFLVACLLFQNPLTCLADEKLLVVTEVWPPFRIASPDSKYGFTGIDIDILEGLERHLNLKIEIQRHPFARALEMIKTGYADLTTGVAYTDQRATFISYVPTPYYAVRPVFYAQKGLGHLTKVYDDLYKFKIGYSLHSAYFEPFNSDLKLMKEGVSTETQLIKMIALGRIDLIIGTNPNLAYDIKIYGLKDKVEQTHYTPSPKTPVYIGLSNKHTKTSLGQKIDDYLKQIIDNGKLKQIVEKYR